MIKYPILLFISLFFVTGRLLGGAPEPYPAELHNFLPLGAQLDAALSQEKKNIIESERPTYKNRRSSFLPEAFVYVFAISDSHEAVKKFLQQKKIILREVALPESNKSGQKLFMGKSSAWHISLATHFLDWKQKKWVLRTTLTFTKIVSQSLPEGNK